MEHSGSGSGSISMAELLPNEKDLGGCPEWAGGPLMPSKGCLAANGKEALRGGAKCQRWDYVNQASSSQRSEA